MTPRIGYIRYLLNSVYMSRHPLPEMITIILIVGQAPCIFIRLDFKAKRAEKSNNEIIFSLFFYTA